MLLAAERLKDECFDRQQESGYNHTSILLASEKLRADLKLLDRRQTELEDELTEATSEAVIVSTEEKDNLHRLLDILGLFQIKSDEISTGLQSLNESSETLSLKLKRLVSRQRRLEEVLDVSESTVNFRTAAERLQTTIKRGDFEEAVKCVSTIRHMQAKMRILLTAEKAVYDDVKRCEATLGNSVRQEFDRAISVNDRSAVSRAARLLPLLGMQREGISRYLGFLRHFLSDRCGANFAKLINLPQSALKDGIPLAATKMYSDVLTDVFVVIADLIQEHQSNIEQEFGLQNFVLFLRGLQEEADVQGVRILDKFSADHEDILYTSESTCDPPPIHMADPVLEEMSLLSMRFHQFQRYISQSSATVIHALRTAPEGAIDPAEQKDTFLLKLNEPES
eukprot:Lankesteria_metandrocarpae@DN3849_c0_g2_i1.p1